MSQLDCELTRLRIDLEMKRAIQEAARLQGITVSAWRKLAYSKALSEQLGPVWRKRSVDDQQTDVD